MGNIINVISGNIKIALNTIPDTAPDLLQRYNRVHFMVIQCKKTTRQQAAEINKKKN